MQDDIKLPALPEAETELFEMLHGWRACADAERLMLEYARAAVLADREQRKATAPVNDNAS